MRHSSHPHRSTFHAGWANSVGVKRTRGARIIALLLALLIGVLPATVSAQSVPNFRVPPVTLPDPDAPLEPGDPLPDLKQPDVQISAARNVIVDTDPGIDDATALLWLLSQQLYPINPLGIVTVAGNTSMENATNNVLLLLDWLGRTNIPVVKGASKPSRRTLSRVGAPIHGPDGLWFLSTPYNQKNLPKHAARFYCDTLAATPDTLVISLGPMTNLEDSIRRCKNNWQGVEIVSVGGAKFGGNQTPVTEYNYWQDPDAAEYVLANAPAYGYTVRMVPFDVFSQFTLRPEDLDQLAQEGIPAIQQLLPAIHAYAAGLAMNGEPLTLPDVAGVIYALDNAYGDAQSALIQVLSHPAVPDFARGQTVVGLYEPEKLTMIATDRQLNELSDLAVALMLGQISEEDFWAAYAAILNSQPDNATFVTNIYQADMVAALLEGLKAGPGLEGTGSEPGDAPYQLFVPVIE